MTFAVGNIETQGFPAVLAAADAMVKAGNVTISMYERSESGRQHVSVRGPVAEVERAVAAGLEAANACPCIGEATAHIVIPNPSPNVDAVLPIHFIPESEAFRVF